jgi:hypothetical protein
MSIFFSHSANKITSRFETDSLIGLLTSYALIDSYGKYFCPDFSFHFCFSLHVSFSLFFLSSFLIIDAQASKHLQLACVADLSNDDSLIPDNGTGSVEAVAVAAPASNWICTDSSHLNLPKVKFCEPSADLQNLGTQSWWQHSNIKTTKN